MGYLKVKYLRGQSKARYQQALDLIAKKDVKGLKRFGRGHCMALSRSCAVTVMDSYTGNCYWEREDALTDEFNELFKANGIKDILV